MATVVRDGEVVDGEDAIVSVISAREADGNAAAGVATVVDDISDQPPDRSTVYVTVGVLQEDAEATVGGEATAAAEAGDGLAVPVVTTVLDVVAVVPQTPRDAFTASNVVPAMITPATIDALKARRL